MFGKCQSLTRTFCSCVFCDHLFSRDYFHCFNLLLHFLYPLTSFQPVRIYSERAESVRFLVSASNQALKIVVNSYRSAKLAKSFSRS